MTGQRLDTAALNDLGLNRQTQIVEAETKLKMEVEMTHLHTIAPESIKDYVLAGKATLTIENTATGGRFTFKIVKPNDDSPHFVRVLTGPDNTRSYTFLGTIFDGATYKHDRKRRISETAPSAKAWAWFWGKLAAGQPLPESVKVYHHGKCGRCGRLLTVPESIESGIGPICAGKAEPVADGRKTNVIKNAKAIQRKARQIEVENVFGSTYKAHSPSGADYQVRVRDGNAYCSCEWADYRRKNDPRTGCSHSIAVLSYIEQGLTGKRTISVWTDEADAARQHRPTRHIGDGVVVTSRLDATAHRALLEREAELDMAFARHEMALDQAAFEAKLAAGF